MFFVEVAEVIVTQTAGNGEKSTQLGFHLLYSPTFLFSVVRKCSKIRSDYNDACEKVVKNKIVKHGFKAFSAVRREGDIHAVLEMDMYCSIETRKFALCAPNQAKMEKDLKFRPRKRTVCDKWHCHGMKLQHFTDISNCMRRVVMISEEKEVVWNDKNI